MGIVSCKENYTRSANTNEKRENTYTRTWTVVTDDPKTGGATVKNAVPVSVGHIYQTETEYDETAACLRKNATCVSKDGKRWNVTVEYGSKEKSKTPLEELPKYHIGGQPATTNVDYNVFGNAIINSAEDAYSSPVVKQTKRTTMTVVVNKAWNAFDISMPREYADVTNSNWFFGAAPGTLKCTITGDSATHDEIGQYWIVKYEFEHSNDPKGWDSVTLDAGFNHIENGKKKKIMIEGKTPSEPVLLDGKGGILPKDGQPQFRYDRIYNRVPFSFGF